MKKYFIPALALLLCLSACASPPAATGGMPSPSPLPDATAAPSPPPSPVPAPTAEPSPTPAAAPSLSPGSEGAVDTLWRQLEGHWVWADAPDVFLYFGYDDGSAPITCTIFGYHVDEVHYALSAAESGDGRYTAGIKVPAPPEEVVESGYLEPHEEYTYDAIFDLSGIGDGVLRVTSAEGSETVWLFKGLAFDEKWLGAD